MSGRSMRTPIAVHISGKSPFILAAVLAGCSDGGPTPEEPTRPWLTLPELSERAADLDEKRVRVRGWVHAASDQTLLGCTPMTCTCNTSSAQIRLTDIPGEALTGPVLELKKSEVGCSGDDCHWNCSGWNPVSAPALELVGILVASFGPEGQTASMQMELLDREASSQLSGADDLASMTPSSLELGSFVCRCSTSQWMGGCGYDAYVCEQ